MGKEVAAIGRMKLPSSGFEHGVHMALHGLKLSVSAIRRYCVSLTDGDGGQGSDGCCGETTAQIGPTGKLWRFSPGCRWGQRRPPYPLRHWRYRLSISCMLPTIISTNTLTRTGAKVLITDSIKVVTRPAANSLKLSRRAYGVNLQDFQLFPALAAFEVILRQQASCFGEHHVSPCLFQQRQLQRRSSCAIWRLMTTG